MSAAAAKELFGKLVFEQVPCPVALLDGDHRLVSVNPAFRALFGAGEGTHCFAALKHSDAPCESCAALLTAADGQIRVTHLEGRDGGGQPRQLRVRLVALPRMSEAAAAGRVLLLCEDLSEAAALRAELKQVERLASVGLTVAGLAHTVKNILAGLEGGIYIVDSAVERDDKTRLQAGWQMVRRYVEQVGSLVRNLLSFAKVREPQLVAVAPAELAREVVELFGSQAALAQIELEVCVCGPAPAALLADREALHACLSNLLANAIDACTWDPDAGKQHRIELAVTGLDGGGVRFEVADNGMGVSEQDRGKIFSTLFTSKGIRGTGLGLLLTRKAVEEHGGRVSFTSTPGEGASFRIELPRRLLAAGHAGEADAD